MTENNSYTDIQLDADGIDETDGAGGEGYDDDDDYSYFDDLNDDAYGLDVEGEGGDNVEGEGGEASSGDTGGAGQGADESNNARETIPDLEAIKREAYERGIREGRVAAFSGKKNEYTGQPIKDEYDLEVYETMRAIEESGGDPVADFASVIANKRRADAQKANERAETEQRYQTELVEFTKEMPDVDLKALFDDSRFRTFARGKLGAMSLKEVYADYSALTATAETDAELKAKRIIAKQKASPGALSGKGTPKKLNEHEVFEKMLHGELD